jgi:hypothetical protein
MHFVYHAKICNIYMQKYAKTNFTIPRNIIYHNLLLLL